MTRAPSRGRGMPTVLDDTTVTAYLSLVRHGMRLGDAAQQLRIGRSSVTRRTRVDRTFATALDEAREVGKKVREEGLPHDEYRYNILKCRCPTCTRAATVGRANRRAAAEDPPGAGVPETGGGQVHAFRAPAGESLPSFLLARAS